MSTHSRGASGQGLPGREVVCPRPMPTRLGCPSESSHDGQQDSLLHHAHAGLRHRQAAASGNRVLATVSLAYGRVCCPVVRADARGREGHQTPAVAGWPSSQYAAFPVGTYLHGGLHLPAWSVLHDQTSMPETPPTHRGGPACQHQSSLPWRWRRRGGWFNGRVGPRGDWRSSFIDVGLVRQVAVAGP